MHTLQKNDDGTVLQLAVLDEDSEALDVADAETMEVYLRKPSGEVIARNLSLVNDGTDGLVMYVTEAADLDEAGYWQLQAYVEFASQAWRSDRVLFRVKDNLA